MRTVTRGAANSWPTSNEAKARLKAPWKAASNAEIQLDHIEFERNKGVTL